MFFEYQYKIREILLFSQRNRGPKQNYFHNLLKIEYIQTKMQFNVVPGHSLFGKVLLLFGV